MPRADWKAAERAMRRPDTQTETHLRVSIRMALSALPWRLLTGAERGPRDHEETERRLDLATDYVLEAILRGKYRIELEKRG